MKANKIQHEGHAWTFVVLAIVGFGALAAGLFVGYEKLSGLYLEQCVVSDRTTQVNISAGKMVLAGTLAEEFGLTNGANLARIDFARKRAELLERVPNLREIHITRKLPNEVTIVTEERTPVARLGVRGSKAVTGKVVDTEGMVFVWQRGTQTLPTIREPQAPGTSRGKRITGRTLAALRLIEASRDPALLELGILEVDVSRPDFLVATLGNYSRVKICWEDMDDPSPASGADLRKRLRNLMNALRSQVAANAVIWNATMPDAIYADTQESLSK